MLCHNVCVLIQEQCLLGIEPVFWPGEKKEAEPKALPVPQRVLVRPPIDHCRITLVSCHFSGRMRGRKDEYAQFDRIQHFFLDGHCRLIRPARHA